MKALVIMHVASEGPGTLGTFLQSVAEEVITARLYKGDSLTGDPGAFDVVVSMGGPMNVYEEDAYPFLRDETIFLEKAISANIPIIGICLGAQMIAKAAGARVTKSPEKEVGWKKVLLTEKGVQDPILDGIPGVLDVFQWHEDMFDIPKGGQLLATSSACPHQAFRYRNAVGLQFHVEVTEEILSEWFEGAPERGEAIAGFRALEKDLVANAQKMYRNFLALVG